MKAFLAALAVLVSLARPASGSCPNNYLSGADGYCPSVNLTTTAPASSCGGPSCDFHAAYDLHAGTASASASVGACASVTAADSFVLVTASPNRLVEISIQVHMWASAEDGVHGQASSSSATFSGSIGNRTFGASASGLHPYVTVDTTVSVTGYVLTNKPFYVSIGAGASSDYGGGGAGASVTMTFGSLPPDVGLSSCNGNIVPAMAGGTEILTGSDPNGIAMGDLNGDGVPDFAVADLAANAVSILGSAPGGAYTRTDAGLGTGQPWSVSIGDFNGDGYPDVVGSDSHNSRVFLLLGNGNGTFQTFRSFSSPWLGFPTALATGDFDEDGRADVAVCNYNLGTICVFIGTTYGELEPMLSLPVGSGPRAIVAADFNGDHHLDLAVSSYDGHEVSILSGRGDGTFFPKSLVPTRANPVAMVAGQFNGDGRADLAVAMAGYSEVVLFLSGTDFNPAADVPAPTRPSRMAVHAASMWLHSQTLRFRCEFPAAGRAALGMYAATGARVRSVFDGPAAAGTRIVDVSTRGLASGVYFLQLRTERESATARVLVLH